MSSRGATVLYLALTGMMSGLCGAAYSAAPTVLEEVVVTASRLRLEDVRESPIAVAVVQEEALDEFNLLTMQDIANIIPSVDISTSRQGELRIRGIGSGGDVGFDSSVSLVIDDIPFSRGAWVNPAYFDV